MEKDQAHISYIGSSGNSKDCTEAIIDLLGRGEKIEKVKLLSSPKDSKGNASHGFLITFEVLGWFIVLPGYASGYGGTGPNHLSRAIGILDRYGASFPEIELNIEQFKRLESGSLLNSDIDYIYNHPKYYCGDVQEYLFHDHYKASENWSLLERYDSRIPIPILHPILQPYAFTIFKNPEAVLRELYTKLEQHLKAIAGVEAHKNKYIDEAFQPNKGKSKLKIALDDGQQDGFKFLVKGLTQLHRNQIMHNPNNEFHNSRHNIMSEFLLINHIFRLSEFIVENNDTEATIDNDINGRK